MQTIGQLMRALLIGQVWHLLRTFMCKTRETGYSLGNYNVLMFGDQWTIQGAGDANLS